MTDYSDRLNRIESILEGLAQRNVEADARLTRIEQAIAETRKIADSNARSIQAWSLTIEDDRAEREQATSELRVDLNEVRQTIAQTAELQQMLLTRQLQDRDEWRQQRRDVNQQIQTLIDNQNHDRQQGQQRSAHLDQQIQSLIDNQNHDRQQGQQRSAHLDQQIQSLIDNQNHDRQQAQQRSAHLDQQIQSLIDLSRENTQAHAEFRADIERIWNRLAG